MVIQNQFLDCSSCVGEAIDNFFEEILKKNDIIGRFLSIKQTSRPIGFEGELRYSDDAVNELRLYNIPIAIGFIRRNSYNSTVLTCFDIPRMIKLAENMLKSGQKSVSPNNLSLQEAEKQISEYFNTILKGNSIKREDMVVEEVKRPIGVFFSSHAEYSEDYLYELLVYGVPIAVGFIWKISGEKRIVSTTFIPQGYKLSKLKVFL